MHVYGCYVWYTCRSVNATPPLHRPNPPALPPRNRHCSEGEREVPLSASLGSSPSDRGFVMNGRVKTPSGNVLRSSAPLLSLIQVILYISYDQVSKYPQCWIYPVNSRRALTV